MTKITVTPDCGNAPKKAFLRDFNVAFARADIPALLAAVTENVRWNMVGDKVISGKEHFAAALEEMKEHAAAELVIDQIITHGREAAVSGTMVMQDGRRFSFADIYTFRGAKGDMVSALVSYVVETTKT